MTWRRGIVVAVSLVLTVASFVLLSKISSVDIQLWIKQLRAIKPAGFLLLVLLTAFHIFLANWKWRCVDDVLRRPTDSKLPWSISFALTSIGVALGQVLPVQACMTAARSFGTYLYGSPLRRGAAGTLFEQGFDVLIVVFLAIASGVTWFCSGGWLLWMTVAVSMSVTAILAVGTCLRWMRAAADFYFRRVARRKVAQGDAPNLPQLAFLNVRLGRRLMLLSAARSLVQIMMVATAAQAAGIDIPAWKLSAALPFVIFATVLAITPGGLGVTELTYAAALNLFGVPLDLGGRWALTNRALVLCSCFIVAMIAGVLALGERLKAAPKGEVIENLPLSSGS